MHAPIQDHLEVAYKIFRHLKGCLGKGILYRRNGYHQVEVYTNADYASSLTEWRSTSRYCSFVGGNLVAWRSKKQSVVARSSAEAQFKSMAHDICKMLWLRMLLVEVEFPFKGSMNLYCDNKTSINIAHDSVQHDRTKHVEVDCHFIKDHLRKGNICTPFI